ncbi:hypothetical protein [Pseudomonas sp. FME51]|uniref:hypothetical protein n=1 Tax=Pseudomonas sp. FME51 TaxID=2742609 RepID=UPI001868BCB7|nr:hypothetical protein [Pseudomonas sp. FME51]
MLLLRFSLKDLNQLLVIIIQIGLQAFPMDEAHPSRLLLDQDRHDPRGLPLPLAKTADEYEALL